MSYLYTKMKAMIHLFAKGTTDNSDVEKTEFTAIVDATNDYEAKAIFAAWLETAKPNFKVTAIAASDNPEVIAGRFKELADDSTPIGKLTHFRANREVVNDWRKHNKNFFTL